jgi:hypothetical protein
MSTEAEKPVFSSDTKFSVPTGWDGLRNLLAPPTDSDFRAAIECFIPADSQAYRTEPPGLSIGDSKDAKEKKRELVGDEITLRDYTESNNDDPSSIPSDLGLWSFSYPDSATGRCTDSRPVRPQRSALIAVLCPVPGQVPQGNWTIRVHLQGAKIGSSSHRPVQYSDGADAIWKIRWLGQGGFWVELDPERAPNMYLGLKRWHNGLVPSLTWPLGWLILFLLLLISTRHCRILPQTGVSGYRWDAVRALQGVAFCALCATLVVIAADAFYNLSSDKTPHAAYARIEAILAIALVSAFGLRLWRWSRLKLLTVLGVAALGAIAYFGPGLITLESGQSRNASTATLDRWQLVGYLNHLLIGAASVSVIFVGAARLCSSAVQTISRSNDRTSSELPRRRKVTAGGAIYYPVAAVLAVVVVSQWVRGLYDQWDHRRLVPGQGGSIDVVSAAILPQLPWFPDFLLHWLPALLYYIVTVCALAALAQQAAADTSWQSAILQVPSSALAIIALLFDVAVVGLYGSYRSLQIPTAFLAFLVLGRLIIREPSRLKAELAQAAGGAVEVNLEKLQQALLVRSRAEMRSSPTERSLAADEEPGRGVFSDQELAIALGPRVHWWGNGMYATKVGLFIAGPIAAYDTYRSYQAGVFSSILLSRSGLFDALLWILSEGLTWIIASFALGALWPLIVGRRGVHKGLALGAVVVVAACVDLLLSRSVGQAAQFDVATWAILILAYLGSLAVILDLSTLKNVERRRWEFVDYLRLRDTRWLATYGVTAVLIVFAIIQQIRSGQPLTSVPGSVITGVLKGG